MIDPSLKDELNEHAPSLSKLDKQERKEVPPRYFEQLGDEVMKKIRLADSKSTTVIETQKQPGFIDMLISLFTPRTALAFATVVLLILAGNFMINQPATDTVAVSELSDISDEELNLFISENINDFEEDLLAAIDIDNTDDQLFPATIDEAVLEEYYEQVIEEIDADILNTL